MNRLSVKNAVFLDVMDVTLYKFSCVLEETWCVNYQTDFYQTTRRNNLAKSITYSHRLEKLMSHS